MSGLGWREAVRDYCEQVIDAPELLLIDAVFAGFCLTIIIMTICIQVAFA